MLLIYLYEVAKPAPEPEKKRKKVELSLREEIEAEFPPGSREPPEVTILKCLFLLMNRWCKILI